MVSVVGTATIQARMGDSRLRVVFGVVCSLGMPVLLKTSYINRFLKGIFQTKRKRVLYNSKPVPNLVIKDMPEKHKNKAQDVLVILEHDLRLVRVSRQTKISPRSKGFVLVTTDPRELVQVGSLLERDSAQAWTAASAIIDAFPNKPFNFMVLNLTTALHFREKHQRVSTALPTPSTIIHNKCHETSPQIWNTPLCESINRVHYQSQVDMLQQMANH